MGGNNELEQHTLGEPVAATVAEVSEWAQMIADHGIMISICAIVLMFVVSYGLIWLSNYRREKSGDFVHRDKLIVTAREAHPELFRPTLNELPKLDQHPVFATWEKLLRDAERSGILVPGTEDRDDAKTSVFRALVPAAVRPSRKLFNALLHAFYEDQERFEAKVTDSTSFQDLIAKEYARLIQATALSIDLCQLPDKVAQAYMRRAATSDEIADRMLERSTDHPLNENYYRLLGVLDTQYARCLRLGEMIRGIVEAHDCADWVDQRMDHETAPTMRGDELVRRGTGSTGAPSRIDLLADPSATYNLAL